MIAKAVASDKMLRPTVPGPWPQQVCNLLDRAWNDDYRQRPEFEEIRMVMRSWREAKDAEAFMTAIACGTKKGLLEKMRISQAI